MTIQRHNCFQPLHQSLKTCYRKRLTAETQSLFLQQTWENSSRFHRKLKLRVIRRQRHQNEYIPTWFFFVKEFTIFRNKLSTSMPEQDPMVVYSFYFGEFFTMSNEGLPVSIYCILKFQPVRKGSTFQRSTTYLISISASNLSLWKDLTSVLNHSILG